MKGALPNRVHAVSGGERYPRLLTEDVEVNGERFKKGTLINKDFINAQKTTKRKEAAHQLNRRTEVRIINIE